MCGTVAWVCVLSGSKWHLSVKVDNLYVPRSITRVYGFMSLVWCLHLECGCPHGATVTVEGISVGERERSSVTFGIRARLVIVLTGALISFGLGRFLLFSSRVFSLTRG